MSEQVIERSIEETNKLRAELGLAPLRVGGSQTMGEQHGEGWTTSLAAGKEEVFEMSVQETNALREKLGLPPLRTSASVNKDKHAPAPNQGLDAAAKERIEKSKLKRFVEEGARKTFAPTSLASEEEKEGSLLSWAQKMRKTKTKQPADVDDDTANKKQKKNESKQYGESDLKGLSVAHSLVELEGGSTTVLTLADTEILQVDENSKRAVGITGEEDERLENVNLAEARKQREGLHEKRQVELGMGRAGGYAGFDDDEFVELGGTQGPSRQDRTAAKLSKMDRKKALTVGFQIGSMLDEQDELHQRDAGLFASLSGQAVSLESSHRENSASDFMTMEEDEELNEKKKKKDKFKKKKKDKKKGKKRKTAESDEEDEEPNHEAPKVVNTSNNLLANLEETAGDSNLQLPRKRRLSEDDIGPTGAKEDNEAEKRSKYADIMQKGNERTKIAFQPTQPKSMETNKDEEEPDDAFLNAALSKARRLNRLKQMAGTNVGLRGEDAVLEMVRSTALTPTEEDDTTKPQMVFSVDETREFTRALRAREEQNERSRAKVAAKKESDKAEGSKIKKEKDTEQVDDMEVDDDNAKLSELAKEIKEEEIDVGGLDGTTRSSVAIGRGLGGVLNILKQTGEITRKNAGREEQRGRARDERTYEDYEPLDLSKVVQIDERTATQKDKELAHREVKLEYRDKHGRLMTRKEAFRDLSYHFHGYGSGKRKQEKKLQQIAREQAEQRLSSKQASQDGGILGALKATQKATGKAFIVHKTS